MKYVENLLIGKRIEHQAALARYQNLGQHENVDSCLRVISELEYVLKWLDNDETYQKY